MHTFWVTQLALIYFCNMLSMKPKPLQKKSIYAPTQHQQYRFYLIKPYRITCFILRAFDLKCWIVKIISKTVPLTLMPWWTNTINCNNQRAKCEWLWEKELHIRGVHAQVCALTLQEPQRDTETRWCISINQQFSYGYPQVSNTSNLSISVSNICLQVYLC